MFEDDEPHLDSSLDMTWQCLNDLDNAGWSMAKRMQKGYSCCSPVSGSLILFVPCKFDLFALWRQFGQPAGRMTLCEAYANSCFDRMLELCSQQVFWHFNAFPKSAEVLLVENLLCFAWNCNQTGYCCISFRIMWLSVMFIAFFVILLTCPRCPSQRFLTAQHTPLQFPGWCPSSGGRDSAVVSSSVDVVCVCFWNFLLRPFRIYSDACVNGKQNEGNAFDSWIPMSYDLIRMRQSSLVVV